MGKLATWIGITIGNLIYYGPQARWEDLFTASYFSGGALLVYHLVCRVSRSNTTADRRATEKEKAHE